MGERKYEFCLFIPVGFQEFFYTPLNLTTWDLPALLPVREEGVLRIFIALKNPPPWPGSNPQPLGPVASTLTTTPQRRLGNVVVRPDCDWGAGILFRLLGCGDRKPIPTRCMCVCVCVYAHAHTASFYIDFLSHFGYDKINRFKKKFSKTYVKWYVY
jgi:hypothetical protein